MLASYRRFRDRTVRVHTTSGTSIEGVLTLVARDVLVLRAASHIQPDANVPLDGEAVVPLESVDFLQAL